MQPMKPTFYIVIFVGVSTRHFLEFTLLNAIQNFILELTRMCLANTLSLGNCGNSSKLTLMVSRYPPSWVHVPSYQLVNLVPCELTLSPPSGVWKEKKHNSPGSAPTNKKNCWPESLRSAVFSHWTTFSLINILTSQRSRGSCWEILWAARAQELALYCIQVAVKKCWPALNVQ